MATFIGGPCDGQAAPSSGIYARIACGGADYTLHEDGNYYSALPPGAGGAGITDVNTKQIGRAWHRLMHVPSVEAPAAIRRSRAARARLRRLSR